MQIERAVAEKLWPEHAETLSEDDWMVLQRAVDSNQPLSSVVMQPVGDAKDMFLESLLILYWTMKVVQVALQISNEVSDLHGDKKVQAIISKITDRIDPETLPNVRNRIVDIINAIKSA